MMTQTDSNRVMGAARARAFTLIELLIVVAIISILASIATPNFIEAQVRAKVARVKADQRSLATAIESYYADNGKYPIRSDNWNNPAAGKLVAPPLLKKIFDPDMPNAAVGMHVLTTPIQYFTSLPPDPFNTPVKAYATDTNRIIDTIDYWDPEQADSWLAVLNFVKENGRAKGWMLVSVGPDQYLGVNPSGNPGNYPPENPITAYSSKHVYDPTNGSVTPGNVYRFAGGLSQSDILWKSR
ncbi:MAG: prepilin-type N-terminal cleavage/methylation domain-containing protein [bacterium]|nr:prepilin-type N-terminal cleavage/methylation domain-containing protein [Candidatus Sumerlaeota bacterium]